MLIRRTGLLLLMVLGLVTVTASAQQKATAKAKQKASVPATRLTPAQPAQASGLLQYVPDEVAIIAAVQPARVINAKGTQDLIQAANGKETIAGLLKTVSDEIGFKPDEIEEVAVLMDRVMLDRMADAAEQQGKRMTRLNNLKQIGLAMHNFHDVYNTFPDDDGAADDNKGNLSWRVHLLPYLEQSALYQQFNFDEPWDSDHNKTLIEQMPEIFATPGVEEPGKTSMHVFTGEGTPFGGDDAPGIRDFTDGTSNTILAVIAGADKADVWTKPGGLEIDVEDPKAALGKINDELLALYADGSVRFVPADIDAEQLLYNIQHADGHPTEYVSGAQIGSPPTPSFILRSTVELDQDAVLKKMPRSVEGQTTEIAGQTAHTFSTGVSVIFPDNKTMLWGADASLALMLAKHEKSGDVKSRFEKLYPANDAALVVETELLKDQFKMMAQQVPMAGLVMNVSFVVASIDFTSANNPLINLNVTMADEASAQQLMPLANGGFQMVKAQALGALAADPSPIAGQLAEVAATLLEQVTIEAEGSDVILNMPKPENSEQFLKDIVPAASEIIKGVNASQESAARGRKRMPLRQIGLAFHNYHDTFNGFPSFDTPRLGEGDNKGLSWRVHLLPYLEEAPLYEQFHLDEPWDSEHNKTLIEKMPKLFECEGVDKPGHTSYHVFLGEETPFGGDEPKGIRDITDGTSNTLMVVLAGPDTADIWTKPSGIEFNPDDPKAALGNIGEVFLALLCDGSVREISREVSDEILSLLIQHADGMPVGNF